MMIVKTTSSVLFYCLVCWVSIHAHQIKLDNGRGNDTSDCISNIAIPCKSLQYIVRYCFPQNKPLSLVARNACHTNEDLTVIIISQKLVFESLVSLVNANHFTLQGKGVKETTLDCSNVAAVGNMGLYFAHCFNISLTGFTMVNCTGKLSTDYGIGISGSIVIADSFDVGVKDVIIQSSYGHGLVLVNNNGTIAIKNSFFMNNACKQKWCNICLTGTEEKHKTSSSNGLVVIVNATNGYIYSGKYNIVNCKFMNNSVNANDTKLSSLFNHGGGLLVLFLSGAKLNNISVVGSDFINNTATLGGGISIIVKAICLGNTITISNNRIIGNNARSIGGGVDVVVTSSRSESPMNNMVTFMNCLISNNIANFGGGVALYTATTLENDLKSTTIQIQSCRFDSNKAISGSAIHVKRSKSVLLNGHPIAKSYFKNCSFVNNEILDYENHTVSQSGTFLISNVITHFEDSINFFEDNKGTALYILESFVHFKNVTMSFKRNNGIRGGAIFLVGDSSLRLLKSNRFLFEGNSASSYGGAVCCEGLPHYHSESCFIEKDNDSHNVFNFSNNTAMSGIAHDLFASNLISCNYRYSCNIQFDLRDILSDSCLGSFIFSNSMDYSSIIATSPSTLSVAVSHYDNVLQAIPGLPTILNISQFDQLNSTSINKLFSSSVYATDNEGLFVDWDYRIVETNMTAINSLEGRTGVITIQTNTIKPLKVFVKVKMLNCPPGFNFNETSQKCDCSVNQFISYCDEFHSAVRKGYWVGYISNDTNSYNLGFGVCANELCSFNHVPLHYGGYNLNNISNATSLEGIVCGPTRQGILCGSCKEDHTVYYHSSAFTCGKVTRLCRYGVVFYILSEIIPVTVVFLAIVFFNIHLTSGWLYSFMFYAQSLDVLGVDAFRTLPYTGLNKIIIEIYRVLYGIFNLDILEVESLSFCINEHTNTLGSFLIQYITITYSFLLIFATILAVRVNSRYNCWTRMCCASRHSGVNRSPIRVSMINGLTAFVIMSYFKCIDITYKINIPIDIFVNGTKNITVPLFGGDFEYFSMSHLKYTLPAIVVFTIIILPPPLLLLFESLLMKLNTIPRFQANMLIQRLLRLRLQVFPFLDSFQGCFKDNCRCFAGLFFVYRILLISCYLYANSVPRAYIGAELMLFAILLLHLLFQPFQKPWHNKIDIFLLTNLLTVNFITLNQYYRVMLHHREHGLIQILFFVQTFCMAMPIVYICTYASYRINSKYMVLQKLRNIHFIANKRL